MTRPFLNPEDMPHSPLLALEQAIARGADGYFESGSARLNFAELDRESNRFAHFLTSLGVQRGDRVAAMLHNSLDFLIAWFGSSKCGAIWSPTNTAHTGQWLRHQLTDADPALLVIEHDLLDAYRQLGLELAVVVRGGDAGGFDAYRDFPDASTAYRPSPGDISHLIYTSGTTGRAKGCMVSHNYLVNYARLGLLGNPRVPEEVLWTPNPLFHLSASGYAVATLMLGGRVHFARSFSLSRFWNDVEAAGAATVQMLGIAPSLVAAAPDNEASRRYFGKLRVFTGSPSSETQAVIARRFGVQKTHFGALGQSEGGFITLLGDAPNRAGSCGLPTDSFDVRIVDEQDRELPRGEVGEIVYRPLRPYVMSSGYWRNVEATAAKTRNLWWHSGDFGSQDADGYVYFSDRGDDRLRRSGENISSFELESTFQQHEAVAVVAVYAVPAQLGDDDIVVAVVLKEGAAITPEQLWEWSRSRVPRFAVPRYVDFRTDIPRNSTGKILKYELRRQGVPAQAWDSKNPAGVP